MFITFEGIDGSGKSTIIEMLKKYFEEKGYINNFVFTREPGGKNLKIAEKIRELILDNQNDIDSMSEALLYLTSRKIHIEKTIKPALENNKIVICDRFIDSSIAYQGNARSLGMDKIEKLNLMIAENIIPQFTFYFSINLDESIRRMKMQNRQFDRLENENKDFFKKAIEGYEFLSKKYRNRYIVIDSNQTKEKVFEQVLEKLCYIVKLK